MSSLLTNTSSMVALATLRNINMNLSEVQEQISTGKKIATARDNAAVYAITSVMNSDVKGFESISASLNLGSSSVAVARSASEQINELLQEIKGNIVNAQEDNVDRSKIQTDIARLREQIGSIVGAAQFNGLNLLQGSESIEVLSSLDRANDQTVSASEIEINRFDLGPDTGTLGTEDITTRATDYTTGNINALGAETTITLAGTLDDNEQVTITIGDADPLVIDIAGTPDDPATTSVDETAPPTLVQVRDAVVEGINAALAAGTISGVEVEAGSADGVFTIRTNDGRVDPLEVSFQGTDTSGITVDAGDGAGSAGDAVSAELAVGGQEIELNPFAVQEGDGFQLNINGVNVQYVARADDTINDVVRNLQAIYGGRATSNQDLNGIELRVVESTDLAGGETAKLQLITESETDQAISIQAFAGGEQTGGLFALDLIDVSTEAGARFALDSIEVLIQTSVDAAASFGSAQRRIDIQSEFIRGLTDSLKAGIGSLVDADMEAASARLQALQVQQQLGVQALSIANQRPQALLALFR